MEKQKTRSEISSEYKWDLTTIFKTEEDFMISLKETEKKIEDITKYKGHILDSANTLLAFLRLSDTLERKMNKLYYYAHLHLDEDTTNTKYQDLSGKAMNLLIKYSELTSFVMPELLESSYAVVEKYIKENKGLEEYAFTLADTYRMKEHKLSEEEEKILSTLSNTLSVPSDAFEALSDADMKFGMIKDEDGHEVELTESNYSNFISSSSRQVRKIAFNRLLNTYGNFKNTIATTFKGNVDYLTSMAKIKKFNNSLEASLFSENISVSVYNNLIDTVNNNLDIVYKYFDLRKEILGLDEIHLYDMYVELINELDKKYSFEEAKDIVLKALSVLGEDYTNNLKRAFDEKWIDVYNNVGKRGGAYSSGFYDTNPFILLNYEGKLNDVSTLAHELGHSMHTYYSCQNNTYTNSQYDIFVAEVASTVNELLLSKYLIKNAKTASEKLFILNNLLNLFKATIYRQTMFAEFERDMHALKEKGEILTNELLSNYYYKLNLKYFGPNVVVDEAIKYEWERIPHFYYNFYVYKYAIGLSCACYIVDNILNNKENALENYLNFLKSGGSDYPVNELKIAGIDVNDSKVVESALKMFDETIDEFKRIYKEKDK